MTSKTIAGAFVALLFFSGSAAAATRTYTGSQNAGWSHAGNWREGVAPVNGDRVVIDPGSRAASSHNDLSNLQLESIQFRSGSFSHAVTGNGLTFTGSNPISITAPLQVRFEVPVRLTSPSPRVEITAGGNEPRPYVTFVDLQLAGGTATFFAPQGFVGWTRITQTGPASIELTAASVNLGADSAFSGGLGIAATEIGASPGSFGTLAGSTTLRSGSGALAIFAGGTIAESFDLRATGVGAGLRGGGNQFTGSVNLTGRQILAGTFQGPIAGTGRLVVGSDLGEGSVTLANPANTFSGGVEVKRALRLAAAEVIPDTSELVLDEAGARVELGPFTETVRRLDCSASGALKWTPGAMLRIREASRLDGCDLEIDLPAGYVAPAEITLVKNESGAPIAGQFSDFPQDRSVMVNGVERFISYSGGASRQDIALVSKSAVASVDVLVPLTGQATVGQVIAQPGVIRARDASGNPLGNALFRASVAEGCGTFASAGASVELLSNPQGVVTLPSFHATGFNRTCSFAINAIPMGAGTHGFLTVYDPDTLSVVVRHPYVTQAPGTQFFVSANVMAGGVEGVGVGGIPTRWEVVSITGNASATFDGDVVPSSSEQDFARLTGNGEAGVYDVRIHAGSLVGALRVTQPAVPRTWAVGPDRNVIAILDGGAGCGIAQSSYEPHSSLTAVPGWSVGNIHRLTLTGCNETVALRLYLDSGEPNAMVMRYGPAQGDATARWRAIPTTVRNRGFDFVLRDGIDDDDLARNGSITVTLSVAFPQRNRQGMWWSGEAENGWGMSIVQHRDTLFSVIYTYDNAGKPIWYVMPGGTWNAAHTAYTGSLYVPRGSPFFDYNVAAFLPGGPVGTATLTFNDSFPFTTTLDYTIGGVTGRKSIDRQSILGSGGQRLVRGDMWWGGETQNGWGVAVLGEGPTLFSVWFTYDAAGAPTWFVMPGGSWIGDDKYTGILYRTLGSPWLGRPYNPALLQPIPIGEFSLQFSGVHGRMQYTNEGRSDVLKLFRQPF